VTVGGSRDLVTYDVPVGSDAPRAAPGATGPASGLSSGGPAVRADRVVVEPGRGAVVAAQPAPGAPGTLSVVSELGIRYPVPSAEVLAALGYGGVRPVALPAGLVSLLPVGPALDPSAARTP
jgi:hypothetical protein